MKPNWQKLASLAHAICTLWFQFFGAGFAFKGYPFKEKKCVCPSSNANHNENCLVLSSAEIC